MKLCYFSNARHYGDCYNNENCSAVYNVANCSDIYNVGNCSDVYNIGTCRDIYNVGNQYLCWKCWKQPYKLHRRQNRTIAEQLQVVSWAGSSDDYVRDTVTSRHLRTKDGQDPFPSHSRAYCDTTTLGANHCASQDGWSLLQKKKCFRDLLL